MANYYSYFNNSTEGQNTRSEIKEESAFFGMDVSQDINCGIITSTTGVCIPVVADAAGRNSLPQAEGSICIRTDTKEINYYIDGGWERAQKHA